MIKFIHFTIIFIFFPIYIQLFGRDAFTTGTLFVFIAFVMLLFKSFVSKQWTDYACLAICLLIISAASSFSIDQFFLDKSLRSLVQFVSSLLFFVVIYNSYKYLPLETLFKEVERLIFLLIVMIAVQIVIGCALYYIPGFEDYLKVFATRNSDALVTKFDGGTLRLRTLIVGGEAIGECIAVFFPFVLYYVYFSNNFSKYFILILFIIGAALSVTRSAVVLMIFLSIFFYLKVLFKTNLLSKLKGLLVATLFFIIFVVFFDSFFDNLIYRFSISISEYNKNGSIISTINREGVWFFVDKVVWPNLSFFGNGMITVAGNKPFHIHSLYITLIHQFGMVGFFVFIWFFVHLFIKIVSNYLACQDAKVKMFLFCCFLSFVCFLINEIKFEFNRYDSYQKVIWALFAVFALSSHIRKSNSHP